MWRYWAGRACFNAALCTVVFNLTNWSYGVYLYSGVHKIQWKKIFCNSAMISSFLLVILIIAGIQPSGIVQDTLEAAGNLCTPLPLIVVGIMLADVKFSRLFTDWQMYLISVLSLVVFPALTCLVIWLFGVPAEPARVLILLSATPGRHHERGHGQELWRRRGVCIAGHSAEHVFMSVYNTCCLYCGAAAVFLNARLKKEDTAIWITQKKV